MAPDPPYQATLTLPARVASVRLAASLLAEGARQVKAAEAAQPLLPVALAEVVGNAVRHASRAGDMVVCELEMDAGQGAVRVFDCGSGFVPDEVPRPAVDGRLEDLPEAGYGLAIARAVFPGLRAVQRDGRFGVELPLRAAAADALPLRGPDAA